MHTRGPATLLALLLVACGPSAAPSVSATPSNLSATQKSAIGRKIWQNECGGTVDGLTTWNPGEQFPSLGIGHFIWYPANYNGPFQQSWPPFVAYCKQRSVQIPAVGLQRHSPWTSRAQFQREFHSAEMTGLRKWLAANVAVQTDFIIVRSRAALPKILAAAPASERAKIQRNYQKVAATPHGTYALIDYVNFKGDGTVKTERYNGQGWGLAQVLANMNEVPSGPAAATEFSAAAKRMLSRRIKNSPPARGEKRWEQGWHNRCNTYARPL